VVALQSLTRSCFFGLVVRGSSSCLCFLGWFTLNPWLCRGSPGGYASAFGLVVFPRLIALRSLA
jgi:hypothetical protein